MRDQKDQKATGKSEEAIHLNCILKDTETSLRSIYRDLINSKGSKSVAKIKNKYFGLDEKNSSLITPQICSMIGLYLCTMGTVFL